MTSSCKHIIWDWNGTLLNDCSLCVDVLNDLLSTRNLPTISEETYRQNFNFPVIEFYEWLGFETSEESFSQLSREFIGNYEESWLETCALHSETHETLSRLNDQGMSHSVLSAAKQETLELGISHFGIQNYFNGLTGTDNIYAHGKVEQGRRWIEQSNLAPEEIVLIGDTLHDFEVAETIGSHCILVSHGHHTSERLSSSGAMVVNSLSDLTEYLSC